MESILSRGRSRLGVKMKLRFLCVGGFTYSVLFCTLQNVKHEPHKGSGACPPRKFLKNAWSEIEYGAF